ncbi:MAG TPA: hypothetical protein VMT61_11780 [Candidatus Binataceae bacterium]|nr:hypothetical protein [Candidatus Binataceae bacterium]
MRSFRARLCSALIILLTSSGSFSGAIAQSRNAIVNYLTFQLFTAGAGFTTESGKHLISTLPDPSFLDREAKQIVGTIGERGNAQNKLGIVIGPLAMDYTDEQLRTLIQQSFVVAKKYHIAVGFHLDDSKFWLRRSDLWRNPANVEWLDWKGTPNSGQYLNWGEPWKLAPQACFNSPGMLAEARRIGGSVIGPAIAQEIVELRKTGDQALFAGIIVGWETAIGRDYYTHKDLGYCALTNLGFSEKAPPPNPDTLLEGVVRNWIDTWARSLRDAGVPAYGIYSHVAFKSHKQYKQERGWGKSSYSSSVMFTPPSVAFSKDVLPGFTTYSDPEVFNDIYAELKAHGNPPWASAEGTNVDFQSGPPRIPATGMETFLARTFGHGAALVNIYGWDIGQGDNLFRRATEGAQALASYRKFLRGEPLQPGATNVNSPQPSDVSDLQNRMHALPGRIEAYHNAGGDMSLLRPRVERLQQDMKNGQLDAMVQELSGIDAIINAKIGGSRN